MSITITIKNARKQFGNNVVIPNLNLSINKGELFTLLGPSGCGKTTLLRMIAGLTSIDEGDFYFNDKLINNIETHKRNIGMVFQNYALFPHMTTFENVAYGLKNRKVREPELSQRVNEVLRVTQIEHLKDRKPGEMSGGQQQRVSLARAIVIQPDVLLMDEPLSNLDAKLRIEMRKAIREIQQEFGITTIYVTHDQEEALSISDRIAVMNEGVVQQVGSPVDIYQQPANLFVGTFVGQSVLFNAHAVRNGSKTALYLDETKELLVENGPNLAEGKEVILLVRPNQFSFAENEGLEGEVVESSFLGMHVQYKIRLCNKQVIEILDDDLRRGLFTSGDKVRLKIDTHGCAVFDRSTQQTLMDGVDRSA